MLKKRNTLKKIIPLIAVMLLIVSFPYCKKAETEFIFAFVTDIHLQPEKNAVKGFTKAIECVNELNPEFVITGGDLVMDAIDQPFERADMLYDLYLKTSGQFQMPVYNSIGNHEIFGFSAKSGVDPAHPLYAKKMFQNKIGKTYYSFDHKGLHFMILDSIGLTEEKKYRGWIDENQMEWIRADLAGLEKDIPIIITVHIPVFSLATHIIAGPFEAHGPGSVIGNSKELLELFKGYDLKLVLQGHRHFLEDLYVGGIRFITGGAVCSAWWEGPYFGLEEGFLMVKIRGKNIEWEYIDYGWDYETESKVSLE